MAKTYINLACGDSYVESWLNFDFYPHSASVNKANLLRRLPIADKIADVVYSSHFLEHVPRALVASFLSECHRITKDGGILRLALPDWEELCSTYLSLRHTKRQHEQADFLLLEMLDQCVRQVPSGELGAYYSKLQNNPEKMIHMIDFVQQRTGHELRSVAECNCGDRLSLLLKNPQIIWSLLGQLYLRFVLSLLPSAFQRQNVSLAALGEKHAWMYDFHTLKQLLHQTGFTDVKRMTANSSNITDFPFYPLDVTSQGQPRKGLETMYVEAVKL